MRKIVHRRTNGPTIVLTNVELWLQFLKLPTDRGEVVIEVRVSGWSSPRTRWEAARAPPAALLLPAASGLPHG
jgi:hypothetical protein